MTKAETALTSVPAAPTEIAHTTEDDGVQIVASGETIQSLLIGGAGNFLTSLKNDGTPQTQARIYNAISDNTGNIRDMIGKQMVITDLMAYPVKVVDQNGEVLDTYRVVVITNDGKSYGSVADGIFQSIKNIISVCGMAPWTGLTLEPVEKTTRRGFRTLVFRMAV